jgi:hypothetical protein
MVATGQQAGSLHIGSPTDVRWTSPAAAELDGTAGDDMVTIVKGPHGNNLEVFFGDPISSEPAFSQPIDAISSLRLRLLAGSDQVVVDYSRGNPLPAGGLHLEVGGGQNTLGTAGRQPFGDIHVSGGTVDIMEDPGAISLFVEQGATVRLSASVWPPAFHLAEIHVMDDGKLFAAWPVQVLRANALSIAPRASVHLEDIPLILDPRIDRFWHAAEINRYIHNGQLRDRWFNLEALLNDPGDWTLRFETIAGEEVDRDSVVVAAPRPTGVIGDYDDNGVVDQGDLDLVLMHWGADAAEAPSRWRNDRPSGLIDQEEVDAVLLNWGRVTEFLPF